MLENEGHASWISYLIQPSPHRLGTTREKFSLSSWPPAKQAFNSQPDPAKGKMNAMPTHCEPCFYTREEKC